MKNKKEEIEELKESERMYRAIFEGTNEGILCADSKTKKFILANPQICKMLGYTKKELTELGVPDIHPKKDLPYVLQQFRKQAIGEITVAKDLPVLRKDKKVIYCDVSAKSAKFDAKKVLLGLFSDTTERKKVEEELQEAKAETEKKVEERTRELKESTAALEKQNKELIQRHVELAETKKELEDEQYELKKMSETLEKKIAERTKELSQKLAELEKFSAFSVGRELKMMELKKRLKMQK